MAAYFHGGASTDIQAGADGLQTLYLMNPSYAEYTDAGAAATPATANMLLLNSAISSMAPGNYGHQPSPAAQHFVGIPLQPPPSGYNLWAPAATATASTDVSPTQGAGAGVVSAVLSLSSREAPPVTVAAVAGDEPTPPHGLVMNSKYLKAAQELLDEVVSVGKGVEEAKLSVKSAAKKKEDSEGGSGGGRTEDGKSGGGAEMSTAERQELQMKKAKLVSMLDEVEQRYRQYHHQMQAVASSFEAVAGPGSARTYTALALQTISRQFRCLRDAIASQVRAASRALGEDADGKTVGSRLRYIDHQLRQQRALQQLGMMQHGAWRPQRGLPERSVSILRAWLFEHFLHPYPKDSDKVMLAKQTGLTRSQVSNWFINARVRLWKPMVEEMYLEETKDQEPNGRGGATAGDDNSGSKSNNTDNVEPAKPDTAMSSGTTKAPLVASTDASFLLLATSELAGEQQNQQSYYSDDGTGALQPKLKKARADDPPPAFHVPDAAALRAQAAAASHRELLMKFMEGGSAAATARDHQPSAAGYSLFTPAYGQFSPEQFAFAGHGHGQGHGHGGVSLTLGLPHGAAEQTPFLMEHGGDAGDSSSAGGYDIGMQSRKPFALMRDFVA